MLNMILYFNIYRRRLMSMKNDLVFYFVNLLSFLFDDLMDKRRNQGNNDQDKYNSIQKKCKLAKEEWLVEQCKEIETYKKEYDNLNVLKEIKKLQYINKNFHTVSGKNM